MENQKKDEDHDDDMDSEDMEVIMSSATTPGPASSAASSAAPTSAVPASASLESEVSPWLATPLPGSDGSDDGSDSGEGVVCSGDRMLRTIEMLESPIRMEGFVFGDEEFSEEEKRRRRKERKKEKKKEKQKEKATRLVFGPALTPVVAERSPERGKPAEQPIPGPEVGPRVAEGRENVGGQSPKRGSVVAKAKFTYTVGQSEPKVEGAPLQEGADEGKTGERDHSSERGGSGQEESISGETEMAVEAEGEGMVPDEAETAASAKSDAAKIDPAPAVASSSAPAPSSAMPVIPAAMAPPQMPGPGHRAEVSGSLGQTGGVPGSVTVGGAKAGVGRVGAEPDTGKVVAEGGRGAPAPQAVGAPRSYASVARGGRPVSSASPAPGDGILQRRVLEALKKGESTIQVEGKEVDLSFFIERHGLGAFRENPSRGEAVWALPTGGQDGSRRNVVRLKWEGRDTCPTRAKVVELLLGMEFRVTDIFALIHPYGTSEFDVSFVRPEGLELFWANYELRKNEPLWRDFHVQALSRQNQVKKVTVLTRNESLSVYDIMTWLGRYGEVVSLPSKNRDEFGIWSGAWTFMVKLKRSGSTVSHIPSAAFLGRDRIQIFYQGQPKLCYRCGSATHFSASCKVLKCALCGVEGHLAATCSSIRCHLCGNLGHAFSRCPRSFAVVTSTSEEAAQEAASAGEGTSEGIRAAGSRRRSSGASRQRRPEKGGTGGEQMDAQAAGSSGEPGTSSGPVLEPEPAAAETLNESELSEEEGRLEGEGAFSESSRGDSTEEEKDPKGSKKERKRTRSKRVRAGKWSPSQSTPVDNKMPKEGKTIPPLVALSNRFQALQEDEGGPGGPPGSAEPSFSAGTVSAVGGAGTGAGDSDSGEDPMDSSLCLKRNIGRDSSGSEGTVKKQKPRN